MPSFVSKLAPPPPLPPSPEEFFDAYEDFFEDSPTTFTPCGPPAQIVGGRRRTHATRRNLIPRTPRTFFKEHFFECSSEEPSPPSADCFYDCLEHPTEILSLTSPADLHHQLFTVKVPLNGVEATLLIDSGASRNFVSPHFLKRHGRLKPVNLPQPLLVRLADGSVSPAPQELHDTSVLLTPTFTYTCSFVVTPLQGYDGILGKPFLTSINPAIDWTTNTISSPFHLVGSPPSPLPPPTCSVISAARMAKSLRKHPETLTFLVNITPAAPLPPDPPDPLSPSTCLSQPNQTKLHQLLHRFHTTFSEPCAATNMGPLHRINLKPNSYPPKQCTFRMSPAEIEELKRQLAIYLEKGWIRPACSEYGAPVLFARKADGSLRLCIDYRALNAQTIKDRYPLPRMDELFDQLHGAKFFSSFDLFSGYHQARLDPADMHKTAFNTSFGSFEFTVLPFGLTNAPAAFMRLMNNVLRPLIGVSCLAFLDDIIIFSKTEEDHLRHVEEVLDALSAANLKVKLSKCSFGQPQTKFLGLIVSDKGISADPAKVAAISSYPLPTDLPSLRSFLGFTVFYRRFIKGYSTIAAPLTSLTRTTVPFPSRLPPAAIAAFHELKSALLSSPVLLIPFTGPSSTFELYTDASGVGIGAVLLQDQGHGPQPVCYESRKFTAAERNYAIHEQELLAAVHAVKVFRHYLEGCQHFTLVTDHHSIQYFFSQRNLSRRQARWSQDLATYQPNMSIVYRPGSDNQADALSRAFPPDSPTSFALLLQLSALLPSHSPCPPPTPFPLPPVPPSSTTVPSPSLPLAPPSSSSSASLPSLPPAPPLSSAASPPPAPRPPTAFLAPAHLTVDDPLLADIKDGYDSDPYFSAPRRPSFLVFRNDLWYLHDRICVPNVPSLRRRLLYEFHDSPIAGHPGRAKTMNAIAAQFYWPGISRSVNSYVNSCATCQRIKPSTLLPPGLLQPHSIPSRPWSHVSMDLITDLPTSLSLATGQTYDSIATFVCMLTKMAIFVPIHKTISSQQLAHVFIEHVVSKRGLPNVIVSDRDPRITSDFWQSLFKRLGSKLNLSSSHHPETDGQTERTHRTIEQILRAYVEPQHTDWVTWLPIAEFAYNNSTHSSTHQTPFLSNYGFNPTTPTSLAVPAPSSSTASSYLDTIRDVQLSITRELALSKAQQASFADQHRRPSSFKVGDRVRLSTRNIALLDHPSSKFRPRFLGPFTISAVISPVAVKLALPAAMSRVHPVFHVSKLLPWHDSPDAQFPDRPLPDQPIPAAKDFVYGDAFEVHSILEAKIAIDPDSTARPKAPCLFFRVRWAAPYNDPSHDSWEPLRSISKLDALRTYLSSPAWASFSLSDAYKTFSLKFKSKIPKFVTFAEGD